MEDGTLIDVEVTSHYRLRSRQARTGGLRPDYGALGHKRLWNSTRRYIPHILVL
jgi:hypothetical protein